MLTLIAVSVFVSAFLGTGLGLFVVPVWALVPAAVLALAAPILPSLSQHVSMVTVALTMVLNLVGLQLGYLAGAWVALWRPRRREFSAREGPLAASEAPPRRRVGACALQRHRDR